ncbi:MAG: DUF4349 domain-containing protein [Oscillospiraceae bacterium]|nr:DUF4349 domain-containing protein [Oscillospiraceae bacterium]MCL2278850.1 DUF4349 domain-containing protein [Oscillospiraceae bacterium]
MKKFIFVVICVIVFASALTGCAAADNSAPASAPADAWAIEDRAEFGIAAPAAPQSTPMPAMAMPEEEVWVEHAMDDMDAVAYGVARDGVGTSGILSVAAPAASSMAEHIIYTVSADIETVNFEESVAMVHTLMQRYGAFVEGSSISGINHAAQVHGWPTFRNAWFTIRVPVGNLNAMSSSLEQIGNVTHLGNHAMNITSQFIDTQSRLNSLAIQEERLLDMLRVAEDVPDLIAIEERLGDVRHQIESLTTTINNWQSQINFSTVNLNINEVEVFTEQPLIHRTYWERIGDGFVATLRGIGNFFMSLFMWIIVSAPVLLILGVIAVVVVIIVKRSIRASKNKRMQAAITYTPPPPPPTSPSPPSAK